MYKAEWSTLPDREIDGFCVAVSWLDALHILRHRDTNQSSNPEPTKNFRPKEKIFVQTTASHRPTKTTGATSGNPWHAVKSWSLSASSLAERSMYERRRACLRMLATQVGVLCASPAPCRVVYTRIKYLMPWHMLGTILRRAVS